MTKEKMIFFDIETSPNVTYSWRIGRKIDLTADNLIQERKVICICWKPYGSDYTYSLDWGKKQDDREMLAEFNDVLRNSQVAIGHNGDKFDLKWLKTRTLFHGLDPINNIQTIDTLKLARRDFNFNSNRLDYIGKYLGVGAKTETGGFDLWKDVMDGDKAALNKMIDYCSNDVVLLEEVYKKLAPHSARLTTHVGAILTGNRMSCPQCGSLEFYPIESRILASGKESMRRKCKDCRHLYRAYK